MSFGKDSSFVFVMQEGVLVNIGRSDNMADKQPFDSVEEEVWRIFGEYKELQVENRKLEKRISLFINELQVIHKIADEAMKER